MYKCTGCGKEFANAQGLGSHQRFGCSSQSSVALRQANEIVRSQTSGLRSQVSGLKLATIFRPQVSDLRPQTSDLKVSDLKKDLEDLEARSKLTKRKQYVERRAIRHTGIALVIIGALLWFYGGGKFKLPFFGDID